MYHHQSYLPENYEYPKRIYRWQINFPLLFFTPLKETYKLPEASPASK